MYKSLCPYLSICMLIFLFTLADVPKIFLEINELKEDRSKLFKVTIQSFPAPLYAQWKIKEKDDDAFGFLDVNAEEHRGSQNSLPHPVLVVRHTERLKTQIFQIEVHNFIGSSRRIITGIWNEVSVYFL